MAGEHRFEAMDQKGPGIITNTYNHPFHLAMGTIGDMDGILLLESQKPQHNATKDQTATFNSTLQGGCTGFIFIM